MEYAESLGEVGQVAMKNCAVNVLALKRSDHEVSVFATGYELD